LPETPFESLQCTPDPIAEFVTKGMRENEERKKKRKGGRKLERLGPSQRLELLLILLYYVIIHKVKSQMLKMLSK